VFTVTVNTVMMTDEVVDRLRRAWPGVVPGCPAPLSGGFWASMFRVPVTGQPEGVASEVVVRFAPHRAMGAKEAEVQRAVAAQGFPTPPVWVSGPDDGRDGWWSVMDFSPGAPLLAGLDGVAVLGRAPSLLRTLPVQLAEAAATLHRLEPAPITAAVQAAATGVAWSTGDVLDQFRMGADAAGRDDVVAALDALALDLPTTGGEVVCHGDLHPFNVLERDGELVVLDWTGAVLAHPCFDLAFTAFLLANPPLGLPGPLRPVGRAAGGLLARRFVARYARANPQVSLDRLDWFRSLHCARVLVEVAKLRIERGPAGGGHPFLAVEPVAAAHLSAATGVPLAR
jgi:aminoglycoside phosphotransferase (APT) family kinase protein